MEKNNIDYQKIKRGRGRPRVLTYEPRKQYKKVYMFGRSWYCVTCKTGINYSLAGKFRHLKTIKHSKNFNTIK